MTHRTSCWLKVFAAWQLGVSCALGLAVLAPARAAPIAIPDTTPKALPEAQVVDIPAASISSITDEELPSWRRFAAIPTARQASSPADSSVHNAFVPDASKSAAHQPSPLIDPLTPTPPKAHTLQNDGATESSVSQAIHNTVKESVRPAYDQMVESGVVETWHEIKTSLGLDKNQWSGRDSTNGPTKSSSQWDASGDASPNSAPPPRTAAQAEIDRELATMMREKLIDQVTPWLIGFVALYVVVYLIRLVVRYMHWKSSRRIARAQRQAMRHTRRSIHKPSHRVSSPANAPVKSEEKV